MPWKVEGVLFRENGPGKSTRNTMTEERGRELRKRLLGAQKKTSLVAYHTGPCIQ